MKTFGVPEKRRYLPVAVVLASLAFPSALQAAMNDYCVVPPYVVQNVPPNVMIVVDTSGSMYNFAYSDGFNTTATSDDHDCTSGDSCSGFTAPGTYPTYKYYGYFDPDQWYTYGSSKFSAGGRQVGSASEPVLGRELAQLAFHAARRHRAQGPDRREEDGRGGVGFRPARHGSGGLRLPGGHQDRIQRLPLYSVQRQQNVHGQRCERGLRRRGIGGVVGHRQRHRDLRLPDDLHRLRRRSGPGDGRPSGHGGGEGPHRAHLLQHEHRRVRPGRRQRHEPQQRRQPYQHHPAHHEYAAGRDLVDGHRVLRTAGEHAQRAGAAVRQRRFHHRQCRGPVELRDERNSPVAHLRQELRPVHHRRRAVLRRESAGLPRELRQRQVGLQLQRGELPLRRETQRGQFPGLDLPVLLGRRVHRRDRGRGPLHAHDRPAELDAGGKQHLRDAEPDAVHDLRVRKGVHAPALCRHQRGVRRQREPRSLSSSRRGTRTTTGSRTTSTRPSTGRSWKMPRGTPSPGSSSAHPPERRPRSSPRGRGAARTSSRRSSTRAAPSGTTSSGGRDRSRTCGTSWTPSSPTRPSARRPRSTRN